MSGSSPIAKAITANVKRIIDRDVKPHWDRSKVNGDANWKKEILVDSEKEIAIKYMFYGMKAWVLEYGRGSNMATKKDNPYLDRYIGSRFWNDKRPQVDGRWGKTVCYIFSP